MREPYQHVEGKRSVHLCLQRHESPLPVTRNIDPRIGLSYGLGWTLEGFRLRGKPLWHDTSAGVEETVLQGPGN